MTTEDTSVEHYREFCIFEPREFWGLVDIWSRGQPTGNRVDPKGVWIAAREMRVAAKLVEQKTMANSLGFLPNRFYTWLKGNILLNFDPEREPPIPKRSALLKLHKELCENISGYVSKDMNAQEARRVILEAGPDPFLCAFGYALEGSRKYKAENTSFALSPGRSRQIHELALVLDSRLINNDDFQEIVQNLYAQVGRSYRFGVGGSGNYGESMCYDDAIEFARRLWTTAPAPEGESIGAQLEKELTRYNLAGKHRYGRSEVIKLYEAIRFHVIYSKPDVDMRVLDCKLAPKSLNNPDLDRLLKNLASKSATELIGKGMPLSTVMVECRLPDPKTLTTRIVVWKYSSCATILAGIITCISHGLGYEWALPRMGVRLLSAGSDVMSFVECVSVLQTNDGEVSSTGRWIDIDTIVGAAQSLVYAVELWLCEQGTPDPSWTSQKYENWKSEQVNEYYRACAASAQLKQDLSAFNAYEYRSANQTGRESLYGRLDEESENLKKLELEDVKKFYLAGLTRLKCMAKIQEARAANIRGDVGTAATKLDEIKNLVGPGANGRESLLPVTWLFEAEKILLALSTSQPVEGTDKSAKDLWNAHRFNIDSHVMLSKMGLNRNLSYYQYPGTDSYLGVAELLGNYGRYRFYGVSVEQSSTDPRKLLSEALDMLLVAAAYSAKVGYLARTSRWVVVAARCCVRLRRRQDAEKLIRTAETLLTAHTPDVSQVNRQVNRSDLKLAEGEILLLKSDWSGALECFVTALYDAAAGEYARRFADCLYNAGRAACQLNAVEVRDKFLKASEKFEEIKADEAAFSNSLFQSALASVEELQAKERPSLLLREASCAIWDKWASPRGHRFSQLMRNNWDFLRTVDRKIKKAPVI